MKKSLFMLLSAGLTMQTSLALEGAADYPALVKTASAAQFTRNPLMAPSPLAYAYPAFDQIQNAHFAPAFEEALRQHTAEIMAIAQNPANPTFENTVVAMERAGQMLGRVSKVFFNLSSANSNPELEELARELAPKLSAHNDDIHLNARLFQRIHAVYEFRANLALDTEARRLLERYHSDFLRAGANLSASDQSRLRALNLQLATLKTTFSQNLLKESNANALIVDTKAELKGLSEHEIRAAAEAAKTRGLAGKYLITLSNTTQQAQLTNLSNRALRLSLYEASVERGKHGGEFDNQEVVLQLTSSRAQRAQLLGYPNHAAFSLEDETAKSTVAVNKMLAELAPAAVANARKEAAELQKIIDAKKGGFKLAAWDWAYYSEQLRRSKFHFEVAQLRPYFEVNHVLLDGVFFAANKLYGISFKERKDLPLYHPSVRVFEVFDADGRPLALFLADMYARDNKRGGAWMNDYVAQSNLLGERPVIANHLNIPPPAPGQPTLLSYSEVRTAFHEFGHALHGIFSNVRYPRFSGTNVPRDFVEYPSQINQMWALWPEVLQNYARHYQTGEALAPELLDKLVAAEKFNQGFSSTEYLASAILDQSWHQLTPAQIPTDVMAFEAQALKQAGMNFAPVPPRYGTSYFSHIFGGDYAAGYYAYLWSEVLDAETVDWFKENGGLTRKNGDWFRQHLLALGGSVDPMQAFRNFRGRDAQVGPLLLRRGLQIEKKN